MSGWGDYAITAVRYNNRSTRIIKVERREVKPEKLTNPEIVERSAVVAGIDSDDKYTTAIKNEDSGKWEFGNEIHVVNVDGEDFIRTDQNETKEDNLGGLPTF